MSMAPNTPQTPIQKQRASVDSPETYVMLPRRLMEDLRDARVAIGTYALMARLYQTTGTHIPLSPHDLQLYDTNLSYGAARRALDRLVESGYAVIVDSPGRKTSYLPSWGNVDSTPRPWDRTAPSWGRPRHISTIRLDDRLLDVCMGRVRPHPDHSAIIERYVVTPLISLYNIGTYALALVGIPTCSIILTKLGLCDIVGRPLPLPDNASILAAASLRAVVDAAGGLTPSGWHLAGFRLSTLAPPAGQALFFTPIGMFFDRVIESIPENVIGTLAGRMPSNVIGGVPENVIGNMIGNVIGGVSDQVIGKVSGNVIADMIGGVSDQVIGKVSDNVIADMIGGVSDQVIGEVSGNVIGGVSDQVIGKVSGNVFADVLGHLIGPKHAPFIRNRRLEQPKTPVAESPARSHGLTDIDGTTTTQNHAAEPTGVGGGGDENIPESGQPDTVTLRRVAELPAAPPAAAEPPAAPPAAAGQLAAPPAAAEPPAAPPAAAGQLAAPPAAARQLAAPPAAAGQLAAPPAAAGQLVAPPAAAQTPVALPAAAGQLVAPPAAAGRLVAPPASLLAQPPQAPPPASLLAQPPQAPPPASLLAQPPQALPPASLLAQPPQALPPASLLAQPPQAPPPASLLAQPPQAPPPASRLAQPPQALPPASLLAQPPQAPPPASRLAQPPQALPPASLLAQPPQALPPASLLAQPPQAPPPASLLAQPPQAPPPASPPSAGQTPVLPVLPNESERLLRSIGVRTDVAKTFANQPVDRIRDVIARGHDQQGLRNLAGWVVSVLRTLPAPEELKPAPPKITEWGILLHPAISAYERGRWLSIFRDAEIADRAAVLARFYVQHPYVDEEQMDDTTNA